MVVLIYPRNETPIARTPETETISHPRANIPRVVILAANMVRIAPILDAWTGGCLGLDGFVVGLEGLVAPDIDERLQRVPWRTAAFVDRVACHVGADAGHLLDRLHKLRHEGNHIGGTQRLGLIHRIVEELGPTSQLAFRLDALGQLGEFIEVGLRWHFDTLEMSPAWFCNAVFIKETIHRTGKMQRHGAVTESRAPCHIDLRCQVAKVGFKITVLRRFSTEGPDNAIHAVLNHVADLLFHLADIPLAGEGIR